MSRLGWSQIHSVGQAWLELETSLPQAPWSCDDTAVPPSPGLLPFLEPHFLDRRVPSDNYSRNSMELCGGSQNVKQTTKREPKRLLHGNPSFWS